MAFVAPEEAHSLKSDGWVHIDVRDPEDFAELRAADSINIPFNGSGESFVEEIFAKFSSDDKIIISSDVYSFRCARATITLAARGYNNIMRIHGGHEAWIDDPDLPTESD